MDIVKLSEKYIDEVIYLKQQVRNTMNNKEMFAIDSREEFCEIYNSGNMVMFGSFDKNKLMGEFCYSIPENGLGYGAYSGLNIEPGTVVHMDSCAILEEYRGLGLQKKMLLVAEEDIRNQYPNIKHIFAIAHPDNIYSCANLINCGYEELIRWDNMPILGYENLKRILFYKKI